VLLLYHEKDNLENNSCLSEISVAGYGVFIVYIFGANLSFSSDLQWIHLSSDWKIWHFSRKLAGTQARHKMSSLEQGRRGSGAI